MSKPKTPIATLVQAGAGTGKTESLAREIIQKALDIYEQKGEVPRFVATTFTERATAELRERVVSKVLGLSESPEWLREFAQSSTHLSISTIHGVLSGILKNHGAAIGLDPEFTILSPLEEVALVRKTLREVLGKSSYGVELLESYGFGDLVQIVTQYLEIQQSLGKTPKVFPWEEILEEEVEKLAGLVSLAGQFSQEGLTPKMQALLDSFSDLSTSLEGKSPLEKRELILAHFKGLRKPVCKNPELSDVIKSIWDLKVDIASPSFEPKINHLFEYLEKKLVGISDEMKGLLEEEKKNSGYLTFNDLEGWSLRLFEQQSSCKEEIKAKWDYWFVDEFQDTSPIQKKILTHMFRDSWNVYFVGDPQQSIYLFRGADPQVFSETKKEILSQDGNLEQLSTNYRSQPDLLRFMNSLFEKVEPSISQLHPREEAQNLDLAQILVGGENVSDEALTAHQCIQYLKEGCSYSDIAILVRKNSEGQRIALELEKSNIPFYLHSSGGFFSTREVIDLVNLLDLFTDPDSNESFCHVCRNPWFGVDDVTLFNWAQSKGQDSFWKYTESLQDLPMGFKILQTHLVLLKTHPVSVVLRQLLDELGVLELSGAMDPSGSVEANIRKFLENVAEAEIKPGFLLAEFIAFCRGSEKDQGETEAAAFVEPARVNIMTIHKSKGLKFSRVIIPFCSKGFRLLPQFVEKSLDGFWSFRVLDDEQEKMVSPLGHRALQQKRKQLELAESNRVFYVAVTRAADRLTLIGGKKTEVASWFESFNVDTNEGHWPQRGVTISHFDELEVTGPEAIKVSSEPIQWPPKGEAEVQKSQSVTGLLEKENAIPLKVQLESQLRGQAMHYLFELLSRGSNLDDAYDFARERFPSEHLPDLSPISKILEDPRLPLMDLITEGYAEWSFSLQEGAGKVLSGQIDLWGEVDGEIWIVDYKSTKRMSSQDVERARNQLLYYSGAIRRLYSDTPIKLAIVSPYEGQVRVYGLKELTSGASAATAGTKTKYQGDIDKKGATGKGDIGQVGTEVQVVPDLGPDSST